MKETAWRLVEVDAASEAASATSESGLGDARAARWNPNEDGFVGVCSTSGAFRYFNICEPGATRHFRLFAARYGERPQLEMSGATAWVNFYFIPRVGRQLVFLLSHSNKILRVALPPPNLRPEDVYERRDEALDLVEGIASAIVFEAGSHEGRVCAIAADPRGRFCASGDDEGNVRLWDLFGGATPAAAIAAHTAPVLCIAFTASGALATAGLDQRVRLWDVHAEACLRDLVAESPTISLSAAAPSLRGEGSSGLLAAGDASGAVTVWDLDAGPAATEARHRLRGPAWGLAVLGLSSALVAATGEGEAHALLHRAGGGLEPVASTSFDSAVVSCDLLGQRTLVCCRSGAVHVWAPLVSSRPRPAPSEARGSEGGLAWAELVRRSGGPPEEEAEEGARPAPAAVYDAAGVPEWEEIGEERASEEEEDGEEEGRASDGERPGNARAPRAVRAVAEEEEEQDEPRPAPAPRSPEPEPAVRVSRAGESEEEEAHGMPRARRWTPKPTAVSFDARLAAKGVVKASTGISRAEPPAPAPRRTAAAPQPRVVRAAPAAAKAAAAPAKAAAPTATWTSGPRRARASPPPLAGTAAAAATAGPSSGRTGPRLGDPTRPRALLATAAASEGAGEAATGSPLAQAALNTTALVAKRLAEAEQARFDALREIRRPENAPLVRQAAASVPSPSLALNADLHERIYDYDKLPQLKVEPEPRPPPRPAIKKQLDPAWVKSLEPKPSLLALLGPERELEFSGTEGSPITALAAREPQFFPPSWSLSHMLVGLQLDSELAFGPGGGGDLLGGPTEERQ
eukprot:tig00021348_g20592.t1